MQKDNDGRSMHAVWLTIDGQRVDPFLKKTKRKAVKVFDRRHKECNGTESLKDEDWYDRL